MERFTVFGITIALTVFSLIALMWSIWFLVPLVVFGCLALIGVYDVAQ